MANAPRTVTDPEAVVDATLQRVGRRVVLGTPLGLGKANHLVDAFYRRAQQHPDLELVIYTALTLAPPEPRSDLERRLVGPMNERLFGGYPTPAYVTDRRRNALPSNVRVHEFYFQPGVFLDRAQAQRQYVASNYTHVVRDLVDAGLNVLAQLVTRETRDGEDLVSLSCNPDLTLDLLPALDARRDAGEPVMLLGEVNDELPFMGGDAALPAATFDFLLDAPERRFPLFGPPNLPVDDADYAIALHASTLIRDGGTLQLGIGSLGDAIAWLLLLRHRRNDDYRSLVRALETEPRFGTVVHGWGGLAPFSKGLFAASEMLVSGFLELYRAGILARRVYAHPEVQRLVEGGSLAPEPSLETLRRLRAAGVIPRWLDRRAVETLHRLGVLRPGVTWDDDLVVLPDGRRLVPDLEDEELTRALGEDGLGRELVSHVAHACFFLGPRSFYRDLRELPPEERDAFLMTRISWVNQLYGDEALKRAQRKDARFVNTTMKMTLLGAAASDGLEDGQIVSGVGGQYNFVAMAQELEDGRSVLLLRSTRESGGDAVSNLVWSYGYCTIPKHLRDLVITEYGIADVRGRSDEEVVQALLPLADARFQDSLRKEAVAADKLSADWRPPAWAAGNTPARLAERLAPFRADDRLPSFPFGTDLSEEELVLGRALKTLKRQLDQKRLGLDDLEDLKAAIAPPPAARPYLERMGLAEPQGAKEHLLQRAVVYALALIDAV
jgi:acyl-CoA hydrolase